MRIGNLAFTRHYSLLVVNLRQFLGFFLRFFFVRIVRTILKIDFCHIVRLTYLEKYGQTEVSDSESE